MDSCFVRKDFYIAPPSSSASPSEWAEWMAEDRKQAAVAKRAWTKSQKPAALDDRPDTAATVTKRNGRWVQSVALGFAGDFENGNGTLEEVVDATQEEDLKLSRLEDFRNRRGLGATRKGRSARRRANKAKRKPRQKNQ